MWPFASYSPEYVAARVGAGARRGGSSSSTSRSGQALAVDAADVPERADHEADGTSAEAWRTSRAGRRGAGRRRARLPHLRGVLGGVVRGAGLRARRVPRGAARLGRRRARRARAARSHRARDALHGAPGRSRWSTAARPPTASRSWSAPPTRRRSLSGDVDRSLLARDLPRRCRCELTLDPLSASRGSPSSSATAPATARRTTTSAPTTPAVDYRRATLEVLVEFTEHLRLRGFAASLADTIEAYRLAMMLAAIRGKTEPGLDEVREAAIATLCRGDAAHVDGFLWPRVDRARGRPGRGADRAGTRSRRSSGARSSSAGCRAPTRTSG